MDTLRYTIKPKQLNNLTLSLGSGTKRWLQHHDSLKQPIEHFADQDGNIHLQVYASGDTQRNPLKFTFQSEDKSITMELRASTEETESYPFHQPSHSAKNHGKSRPALTEEEALTLSDDELVRRGYSPRPQFADEKVSETWLKSVRHLATRVEPVLAPRRIKRTAKPRGSEFGSPTNVAYPTWCGIEARDSVGYRSVLGLWTNPGVLFDRNVEIYSEAAIWVGLDGDGILPLPQAGVDLQVWNFPAPPIADPGFPTEPDFFFVSPYTWFELFPFPANQGGIGWQGVPARVGDQMQVIVWIDSNGPPGSPQIPGGYAHMAIDNLTTVQFSTVVVPLNGINVVGTEAEWIVEAPQPAGTPAGSSWPLSFFWPFTLDGFMVQKGATVWQSWSESKNTRQITMQKNGNTLAVVAPVPPSEMLFIWAGFQ
jgi:Peptidase A4 family